MKKSAMILLILFSVINSNGQPGKINTKDTLISIRVSGACEMCRDRIEQAMKIKGIRSAKWNVDTKILTLVYSSSILTQSKIHQKIAAAGHDTELEKAKDVVYNGLPACCHYREIEKRKEETIKAQDTSLIKTYLTGKRDS